MVKSAWCSSFSRKTVRLFCSVHLGKQRNSAYKKSSKDTESWNVLSSQNIHIDAQKLRAYVWPQTASYSIRSSTWQNCWQPDDLQSPNTKIGIRSKCLYDLIKLLNQFVLFSGHPYLAARTITRPSIIKFNDRSKSCQQYKF